MGEAGYLADSSLFDGCMGKYTSTACMDMFISIGLFESLHQLLYDALLQKYVDVFFIFSFISTLISSMV